jgi:hypothetical protein
MTRAGFAGAAVFLGVFAGGILAQTDGAAPARALVVAELFTSEGCSSCPPADDVLRQLVERQQVDGVEVIALSEHVDYWDRLGWRDPFSSPLFTKRQTDYDASVFRSNNIYTPQLVIDGAFECLGSDADVVRRMLIKAARIQKILVSVSAEFADPTSIAAGVHATAPSSRARRGPADVVLALVEDGLTTSVTRGENRGRSLRHTAVVRSMTTAATLKAEGGDVSATARIPVSAAWREANLRIVGFVQDRATRRILGAGMAPAAPRRSHS